MDAGQDTSDGPPGEPFPSAGARLRHPGHVLRLSEAGDHLHASLAAGLAKSLVLHRCDGIPPHPEWRTAPGAAPGSAQPLHAVHDALLGAGLARLQTLEAAFTELPGAPRPVLLVLCEDAALLPSVGAWLRRQGVPEGEQVVTAHRVLGRLGEAAWPAAGPVDDRLRLQLALPGRPAPRIVVTLLGSGQDWGATQVCVITVLRTGHAPAVAAHTIAPGQRLMWRRGSAQSLADHQRLRQDNRRLVQSGQPPSTLVDVLTVVEHPRFHGAYAALLHQRLAVVAGRELDGCASRTGAAQRGDLRVAGLREDFQRFDFEIPVLDSDEVAPGQRLPAALALPTPSRLPAGRPAPRSPGEVGRAVGASRSAAQVQVQVKVQVQVQQGFVAFRPDRAVAQGGDRAAPGPAAGAFAARRHAVIAGQAAMNDIAVNRLSQWPQVSLADSRAMPSRKCIYTHQGWPATQGTVERALILWAQADAGVDAFCRLDEAHEPLARIAYRRDDGRRGHFTPDFLVRTAGGIYWVETRRPRGALLAETRHRHRAALAWCERVNRLPPEARSGQPWHYVTLPEHLLLQAQARGHSLPQLLDRTRLRRGAAGVRAGTAQTAEDAENAKEAKEAKAA